MTTHLQKHITEAVNEIADRGCTIPKDILKNYFNTAIALAQATPDDYIGRLITEPESEFIKPEQMVRGQWYVVNDESEKWIFSYKSHQKSKIEYYKMLYLGDCGKKNYDDSMYYNATRDIIRPATQAEVLKYFPDETFNNQTQEYGC